MALVIPVSRSRHRDSVIDTIRRHPGAFASTAATLMAGILGGPLAALAIGGSFKIGDIERSERTREQHAHLLKVLAAGSTHYPSARSRRAFSKSKRNESIADKVTKWVRDYPSLAVGFLPVIGGTISTPMQIGEIERDRAQIQGWRRVALASVLARSRTALPSLSFSAEGPLSQSLQIATGREPKRVVDRHLKRIELMRSAVQHPTFTMRASRQAALQRSRAVAGLGRPSVFRQLMRDAQSGRTAFASREFNLGERIRQARVSAAKRRAINRRV